VRLIDVNVLVYAHRQDSPGHHAYRRWLEAVLASDQAYGMTDIVVSGFLRVVTHPRVFKTPSPMARALAFANQVRERPNCVRLSPGPRHWDIFMRLCRLAGVKGNLVPDAYLAALAIEHGCEFVTTDRDYGRFPGLEWSSPQVGEF
jgi:toxin-antitoxin system PIN domain toxin